MIIPINHIKNARFHLRYLCSNANSLFLCNTKITRYFRNGDIKAARKVFDEMPIKNTVTWNCMISGYVRNGMLFDARKVFDEMPIKNTVTWNCMISWYVKNGMLFDARKVFDEMPNRNVVSWTAMLDGYAKCGRLDESRALFNAMTDKNVVCWNAMLSGYVTNGQIVEARNLFDEMPVKNPVSWATIIEGCSNQGLVEEARILFNECPFEDVLVNNAMLVVYGEMGDLKSLWRLFGTISELDVASWTTVIRCFAKYGKMEVARKLFDDMPEKDVIAWTVMILGYMENDQIEDARKVFDEMPKRDIVAWNTILQGYIRNKKLEEALEIFKKMPKRDVVSWNMILQGYVQEHDMLKARIIFNKIYVKDRTTWNIMICGVQSDEAFDLYSQMLHYGIKPDQVTFTGLISLCGSLAVHNFGKAMHSCVVKCAYANDSTILSSLISMYSKCGFMNDANLIFSTSIKKDTVSWNAIIVAHSHHGSAIKALKLFSTMTESGYRPDHLTFLGLLIGCAHSGMVKESWECFKSMGKKWKIQPTAEHYACMIDVLGRNGKLTEAYELVKQLPVELPSYTWETLLNCCRVHENFELGELVAQKLDGVRDTSNGICVLRSKIYAARGMWDDAANVRTLLAHRGVRKDVGYSWIELKDHVFRFVYDDRSHRQWEELHKVLESLSGAMEIYG